MPRVRARMAAGTSAASWKSAVLRAWPGRIPRSASRWVSRAVLTGLAGWPPGNSQGEGWRAPMVAWPLRFAATVRASAATGSGSWMGMRRHPDGRGATVLVHPGRDVAKGTLRSILGDVGMTIEELQRLL
jgi:hypothetical protein